MMTTHSTHEPSATAENSIDALFDAIARFERKHATRPRLYTRSANGERLWFNDNPSRQELQLFRASASFEPHEAALFIINRVPALLEEVRTNDPHAMNLFGLARKNINEGLQRNELTLNEQGKITRADLLDYIQKYELARFSGTSDEIAKNPRRTDRQKQAILQALEQLGLNPTQLPPRQYGNQAGAKANVKACIERSELVECFPPEPRAFDSAFNNRWQEMRNAGQLVEAAT